MGTIRSKEEEERTGPQRDATVGTKAVARLNKDDPIEALKLDTIASVNVWLAIAACAYASISFVLLLINYLQCKKPEFDVFTSGCGTPDFQLTVSGDTVHRMEFTSAFLFNCFNLLIVAYSDSKAKFKNPVLFKTWAFINLLFSSTAMILIWANRGLFEVPAHQMEYISEISMSFLETKLLQHGIEAYVGKDKKRASYESFFNMLNRLPFYLAVVQLAVFNFGNWSFWDWGDNWKEGCSFVRYRLNPLLGDEGCTGYGDAKGEWCAHCIEYTVGFMNAIQAFFISMDNRVDAMNNIENIMHSDANSRGSYMPPDANTRMSTVAEEADGASFSVALRGDATSTSSRDVERGGGAEAKQAADAAAAPAAAASSGGGFVNDPSLSDDKKTQVQNLMKRSGATQGAVLKALKSADWHAGKAFRDLSASAGRASSSGSLSSRRDVEQGAAAEVSGEKCQAGGCSGFVPVNPDPHFLHFCEDHAAKASQMATGATPAAAICSRPSCPKDTWNKKPGEYCSNACKVAHQTIKDEARREIEEIDEQIRITQERMNALNAGRRS